MKHQLSLEIPDTYNTEILRIVDTSQYSEDLNISCELLQIVGPGFINPVNIEVESGFNVVLGACHLGFQYADCGEVRYDIPDGIYNIKYSVSPNDRVQVEYNHLRISQISNAYFRELGKIEIHGCSAEDCIKKRLKDLREIKSFIDVAKAKVEYYHNIHEGAEILKYAHKKLESYQRNCCK